MSQIQVDNIYNKEATGSPSFPLGANVTGVITATTFKGGAEITSGTISATSVTAASGTFNGPVTIGGTLTYEDVTNIDSVGVITARNGLKVTAGGVDIDGGGIDITGNIGLGGATYGTAGQVLTSGGSGANATWSTISASPEMTGIASGSLDSGKPVALTQDGKLMSVTGVTAALTSAADIPNTNSGGGALVYDSTNDKYVFFYQRTSNNQGRAVVGTLESNNTITWGSEVSFSNNQVQSHTTCAAFDAVNGKVVCFYGDAGDSNYGKVIVGQVSGTGASATITFGSPVDVLGAHLEHPSLCVVGGNYVVAYNNGGDNKGYARIGKYAATNSSTWPNSQVQFNTSKVHYTYCWHDTTANKLLIGYVNQGGGWEGVTIVGTVANDNVTFGSQYPYANGQKVYQGSGVHDSTTGKNMIVYTGSSDLGYGQVLTISGTTISYGTQKVISNLAATKSLSLSYNPAANKFLAVYTIDGSVSGFKSQKLLISGTSIQLEGDYAQIAATTHAHDTLSSLVYDSGSKSFVASFRVNSEMDYFLERIRSSNLSADNYVGISKAAYTNGQTATLAVSGAINESVTGLTTATRYYVGGDGSFITTADSENISAGVAIAANRLLVN